MQFLWIFSTRHIARNTMIILQKKYYSMIINYVLVCLLMMVILVNSMENIKKILVGLWYVSIKRTKSQFSLELHHLILYRQKKGNQEWFLYSLNVFKFFYLKSKLENFCAWVSRHRYQTILRGYFGSSFDFDHNWLKSVKNITIWNFQRHLY